MKTCPYCKEEIKEEAIKCRYCSSTIDRIEDEESNHHVTYILDKDLIRFVKVAGSFLAVFLVVGAFFYGFDLKQATKEIKEAQREAREANLKMKETEKAISVLKEEVDSLVELSRGEVRKIRTSSEEAALLVVSIQKQLSSFPQTEIVEVEGVETESFLSRGDNSRFWKIGIKIRIKFLQGEKSIQKRIIQIAKLWLESANLEFNLVETGDAEIRVAMDSSAGNWSFVGTDALSVPQNQPTMNLAWLKKNSTDEEFAFSVLPQFGHALGLLNEHQNPKSTIIWNEEKIYKELTEAPYYWKQDMIYSSLLRKWSDRDLPMSKPFDPKSVMFLSINPDWIANDIQIRNRYTSLSNGDKEFIKTIYPR